MAGGIGFGLAMDLRGWTSSVSFRSVLAMRLNVFPRLVVLFASTVLSASAVTVVEPEKDLLAFANGTLIAIAPKDSDNAQMAYSPYNLIDESVTSGWRSEPGAIRDQVFVFALAEKSTFTRFVFDAQFRSGEKTGPKDVVIEVSDASATTGFQPLLTAALEETDGQAFMVKEAVPARWVRLTVKNNQGHENYIELNEVRGFGQTQTKTATLTGLTGTYEMNSGLGFLHLKQEGTAVTGFYDYRKGVVTGGVEGRMLKATLTETNESTGEKEHQTALLTLVDGGKGILGFTRRPEQDMFDAHWHGPKTTEDIGENPQIPGWKKSNATADRLEKELEEVKRVRVYGINFDFDSDVIREESKPLLGQIAGMLKEHADWRMTVEGHTDNVGGEAYNQNLSERRARAVVSYLTQSGIDAGKLSAKGFGYEKPVAPNETAAGRAQNRRVELVRQ